jgi:hypothetical protein
MYKSNVCQGACVKNKLTASALAFPVVGWRTCRTTIRSTRSISSNWLAWTISAFHWLSWAIRTGVWVVWSRRRVVWSWRRVVWSWRWVVWSWRRVVWSRLRWLRTTLLGVGWSWLRIWSALSSSVGRTIRSISQSVIERVCLLGRKTYRDDPPDDPPDEPPRFPPPPPPRCCWTRKER